MFTLVDAWLFLFEFCPFKVFPIVGCCGTEGACCCCVSCLLIDGGGGSGITIGCRTGDSDLTGCGVGSCLVTNGAGNGMTAGWRTGDSLLILCTAGCLKSEVSVAGLFTCLLTGDGVAVWRIGYSERNLFDVMLSGCLKSDSKLIKAVDVCAAAAGFVVAATTCGCCWTNGSGVLTLCCGAIGVSTKLGCLNEGGVVWRIDGVGESVALLTGIWCLKSELITWKYWKKSINNLC